MSDIEEVGSLFEDPKDFYPPSPPPTLQTYEMNNGEIINLHLVGHSPLEAHHLWNGSRVAAKLFEREPTLVRNKTVFELGAGAGLPSLVCGVLGARRAVMTDFPDVDLVQNMQKNIDECDAMVGKGSGNIAKAVVAKGFVWGADVGSIVAEIPVGVDGTKEDRFDVLVLADLLFRHSEHRMMVKTIREALKKNKEAVAFVIFTSYRPWLREKDLNFFELCSEDGFLVEQFLEQKLDKPLFENDPGDVDIQKTVTGWRVTWPEAAWEAS